MIPAHILEQAAAALQARHQLGGNLPVYPFDEYPGPLRTARMDEARTALEAGAPALWETGYDAGYAAALDWFEHPLRNSAPARDNPYQEPTT